MSALVELIEGQKDRLLAACERRLAERGVCAKQLPRYLDMLCQALRDAGASLDSGLPGEVHEVGALVEAVLELRSEGATPLDPRDVAVVAKWSAACSAELNAERFMADSQRRFELFEQAPGFVAFLRGPEMVFEVANAAYHQLVGHRRVVGKTVREALPELAGQGYFELLERVYTTGEPYIGTQQKVVLQPRPGEEPIEICLDFIYQPIRDPGGQVTGILVQGQDVTQFRLLHQRREVAEAALRASEERYRRLFASLDDGYCLLQMIVDANGETVDYRFLEANSAFETHTGLVGAVGRTAREMVPDLDESWFRLYARVAATGETARFENHAPALNRWFEVCATRVGEAELRQVALVFKDISERKRNEATRAELFARESAARREAEAATQLRDEFLATVSHELRTPLTSILGWAQMLQLDGLPAEQRRHAIDTIERNARAQAQLIEDLLDVSSILAGKLRLEVQAVKIREIVEAALDTVRPAAEARGVRLQATLASGATVMGDPQRLQQVVWNLLSNAVKFTPRGGRVQVLVERRDSSVEIVVADTGKGIRPEFQPHVFERFRQADGATTRRHGGLGLGLSIVRQLVEMHGGTVGVFSEGEDRGCSFTVRIPLAVTLRREIEARETPREGPAAKDLQCPPELAGLRVLVVDDERDTREMLGMLLQRCGVEVLLAGSAAEALQQIVSERPDVLISDIGMPGEDGYMLLERVRRLPRDAGGSIPAVALTAYARSEDRTRALLAGFNNHVAKPVEPLELLAVIASLSWRTRKPPT
ncbi:PAS domain-containing hybrid sensor histidine kinase/response regulator [Nannocystis exedens]|uniref:PAS domain-containing hybrid sensor histidine kinase/response regulator n=1 Tax=Nannocystis exedens TaxID=54 RepID=UPI000BCA1D0F|nr:ATP-binding protein [Nannocystis exedens]PCC68571.1 histidine kinase [Nannocystis exedens]